MSSTGEPITKCPVCRYNLTGLPRNHRCPECGFEYNERMRVWHSPTLPWWSHVSFVTWLAFLVWNVVQAAPFGLSPVETLLLAASPVFVIAIYVTAARRRMYVLTSDKGLLNVGGRMRRTSRFYRWQDIWIPDPNQRFALPSWHEDAGRAGRSLLFGDVNKGSPYIYVRPRDYMDGSGAVRLDAIHRMPVRARRIAMAEIHRRWREAAAKAANGPQNMVGA